MGLDLVLRGGRVIDPAQGVDAVMDVGFEAGRVAKIGGELSGEVGAYALQKGFVYARRDETGEDRVIAAGSVFQTEIK